MVVYVVWNKKGGEEMKVLRIYDHLGELKKEFNVYVEGEDFKWQASYPEVVWLGTITLEEAGKEPEKPSEVVSESLEMPAVTEVFAKEFEKMEAHYGKEPEPEKLPTIIRHPEEGTFEVTEPEPEVKEEEVKHEPEKVHRKRRGVKRTTPSSNSKSLKVLRQDDPGRDTNQGD